MLFYQCNHCLTVKFQRHKQKYIIVQFFDLYYIIQYVELNKFISLQRKQEDFRRLLSCKTHFGAKNIKFAMKKFVSYKTSQQIHIFNLQYTWQKIMLAARIISSIQNQAESKDCLQVCSYTGTQSTHSQQWMPGKLTNQMTKKFQQPRLLIVTDPTQDFQAIIQSSYVNIPCIALCNTDASLEYVDIVIPCNNRSKQSTIYWLLARQERRQGGIKARQRQIMVALFFTREIQKIKQQQEILKEEQQQNQEQKQWDDPKLSS